MMDAVTPSPKFSRRTLLWSATALAGGVALASCSSGPRIPTPTASPTGSVSEQLDQVLQIVSSGSKEFGVFLRDPKSGHDYSFNGGYASQNASMIKPMLVAMSQRRARAEGGELSTELRQAATLAITKSDNDAATELWQYAGPDAYPTLAGELGMTASHLDENKPDQWSWTWTTPEDQVRFLQALTGPTIEALTDAERGFIYDLMGQVVDDQTWGVGAVKSETVRVHLKNGWVQFKSSDGLWAVNSMGTITGEGRDYQLAVMTRQGDFDTGRELLSEVGRQVFAVLGTKGL